MINNLIGKTKKEAIEYIHNFYNMTSGKEYNADVLQEGIHNHLIILLNYQFLPYCYKNTS